jgi:inosine-uridine nucleoside N-ribohydrolase
MPIPVVLDVDTGVDDACALLLAALHPDVDLRAVTCVAGNAPVDDVVRNTLVVLEAAGRGDVLVGRGAARPLLEVPRPAGTCTARTGWATWERPARKVARTRARPWPCCGTCSSRRRTPGSPSPSCRWRR